MYNAYCMTLTDEVYHANIIQANLSYNTSLIAHILTQQNQRFPKPFKQEPSDFIMRRKQKPKMKEARELLHDD